MIVLIPKCFDTLQQWKQWRTSHLSTKESGRICDDCTRAYERRMRDENRCEAPIWLRTQFGPGGKVTVAATTESDE